MKKHSLIAFVIFMLLSWFGIKFTLQCQTVSMDAEWPCFRRDLLNTGISNLKGPLSDIKEIWTYSLGGGIDFARMKDIDKDGFDEVFTITAGKIVAYQENGMLMWNSPIIGVKYLLDILDLDNDGIDEVVSASFEPPTIFIISATTGEVVWRHHFAPPAGAVYPSGVKIADLDNSNDGKLELFCWPWFNEPRGYAFAFSEGIANGHVIWEAYSEICGYFSPQVIVADMNCDSIPEVVIGTYRHIYGWQGDNGSKRIDFEFTTGERYGRNYGVIKLTNIDDDPYPEVAVLAYSLNEHLTMIDNKGPDADSIELSLLWDKWFEYSYPEDHKTVRISPNSVNDLDDDGEIELACALFNDTGDNQWHLMIYNAQTGLTELDLPGYYLYDIQDLDNDGYPEIFLSQETSRDISKDNLHILKGDHDSYSIVYTKSPASPVMEDKPQLPMDVNSTSSIYDMLFIRDIDFDGTPNIFTISGDSFYCYKYENNELIKIWSSYPSNFTSILLDAGKTGVQSFTTPLISSMNGYSYLIDANSNIIANISIGSYYAMPIAADLDGDGSIEVLVQNAIGFVNVLDVQQALPGTEPRLKWRRLGKGKSAKYITENSTAYVDDINNDGQKEVFIASNNNLLMLDCNGCQIREYEFESYPYEWVTGHFNSDSTKDLFVAFNAGDGHTNIIHVYDGKGGGTPIWTKAYGPYSGYVAVYDFTEDGIDDIIVREHRQLFALNGRNGQKCSFSSGTPALYHTPILLDVDFNGNFEIINGAGMRGVSVNKLHNQGKEISLIWEKKTGERDCYGRIPGTADVDNDGHAEIGVSSTNGTFTCYDASTGVIEWTYNLDAIASDIICMDADNDGRSEFIFGSNDGYLYVMNGETDASDRIEAKFNLKAQVGSPIVVDLNADGIAELLVTTYDGKLHCLAGEKFR